MTAGVSARWLAIGPSAFPGAPPRASRAAARSRPVHEGAAARAGSVALSRPLRCGIRAREMGKTWPYACGESWCSESGLRGRGSSKTHGKRMSQFLLPALGTEANWPIFSGPGATFAPFRHPGTILKVPSKFLQSSFKVPSKFLRVPPGGPKSDIFEGLGRVSSGPRLPGPPGEIWALRRVLVNRARSVHVPVGCAIELHRLRANVPGDHLKHVFQFQSCFVYRPVH